MESETMRAVEISRPGGPEVLKAAIRPRPEPQAGEVVIRARAVVADADALRAGVWPLLAAGKVRPVMDRAFPLTDARDAHARTEGSDHIAKIVLEVAGG